MKKMIAAVGILLLSTSLGWAQVAPVADSLVVNASFENGLTPWASWYGTKARITTGQRSGRGALKINPESIGYQDATARLQAGHTYHLSAYAKASTSSTSGDVAIGVEAFDPSGNVLMNNPVALPSHSTSYEQVSMDFTVPAGFGAVDVYAANWASTGSAYFDDFQLVEKSAPAPAVAASTPIPSSTPSALTPSSNGTTISSASRIVDSHMDVWTVTSGVVQKNGSPAAYSANVVMLLYFNGVIYQETAAGGWWSWTGSAWTDSSDPRGVVAVSAATPSAAQTSTSASPTPAPAQSATSETIGRDWDSWNWHKQQAASPLPYWTFNSTWNQNGLLNGRDFTQTITMEPEHFPGGTVIKWSWPDTPAPANVYSYPMLVYGTYAGLRAPITNVAAKQINDIDTLRLSHNLSIDGNTGQFAVMYDGYLSKVPVPGTDSSNSIFEIEVHCHTPHYFSGWLDHGHPKYSFTDSQGTRWSIFDNPDAKAHMIVFVRADYGDLLDYTVDMKELLLAAKSHGLLTGNEYWVGTGLGVEPQMGFGSLTVNSFSVDYR